MSRRNLFLICGTLSLAMSLSASAQNFGAGSCSFPNTVMLPTIQAAVNAAPPGSTIAICPGVYPEQVTVTKPLTLLGRNFGNAGRAVIAVPPGSLSPNITNQRGIPVFAQVLVQNANSPGPVNITDITVDGQTASDVSVAPCVAAIFYTSGTSGTVNEATTRNQLGTTVDSNGVALPCGFGVWAENGSASTQAVTIENSSVHDFADTGIATYSIQGSPTAGAPSLNATTYANFVTIPLSQGFGSNTAAGLMIGIDSQGASVTASNNVVDGLDKQAANFGVGINGGGAPGSLTISDNTVADFAVVGSAAIAVDHGTAQSNRISNATNGIAPISSTITSNRIMNTQFAAVGFSQCSDNSTVSQNVLNDSAIAFANGPNAAIGSNQIDNIDTVFASPVCP